MYKTLRTIFFAMAGLLATFFLPARAATLGEGDYARVGVPNLAQAAAFFGKVLDCRLVGTQTVGDHARDSLLLSCGAGSMLELYVKRGVSPARHSHAEDETLQFVYDGALNDVAWLRQHGAVVRGAPHRLTGGEWAGRVALDFEAPWGLPLRLLGGTAPETADEAIRTSVAVQDTAH